MQPLSEKDTARFWEKVKIGGPDECWDWQAGRRKRDYGGFKLGNVFELASRVSHFIATGEQPTCVRHKCDRPVCVNPAHLLGGSHADNMADAARRERYWHKISAEQVRQIRASEETTREAASRYGLTTSMISMIRNGKARIYA